MIEFPVTSQASPQPHHASQAAMFSAMLNNLSVDNMTSHTRSLLDCAAQAGNNQARNFGLVSLANNTGDYRQRDGPSVQTDPSSGPLAAMATMTDMKAAAMLSQASNFSSPGGESGSGDAPLSPSPPPPSSSSSLTPTSTNVVNPHGIDSILNRRTAAGLPPLSPSCLPSTSSAADTSNLSSTMSRFGLSNPYLGQSLTSGGKFQDLVSQRAAAIYWPGIQGLMSNPTVWRDRFVLNSK